jgi:poly-beta-1,6-N-acetyl-D-glucosamine synthase
MSLNAARDVEAYGPIRGGDLLHPQPRSVARLECSVGIMAYNEEANIANALESILRQRLRTGGIVEVIVVASGCEDRTSAIVGSMARSDPRVRLVEQSRREGKASAVNLFLATANAPLLLMVSADVVVKEGTIEAMLRHFTDPRVGMVGGHPTPVNSESTFLGHAVHLQWRMHDRIAQRSPKLGEIVAFRNVVPSISVRTAVDEISIEALITQLDYRLVYEPEAVVYNRGPTTVRDFLRQRRRIHGGHLRVREQQGYSASTMNGWTVVRALWGSGSFMTPRAATWSIGTVCLEVTARALGHVDLLRGRSAHIWQISGTTKHHISEGASADSQQNVVVFHIVNFHRLQLELGLNASRQLARRIASRIKRALGPDAIVCIRHSGTIVAVLPGDRDAAERGAAEVVDGLGGVPMPANGRGLAVPVKLAYGLIAFPPSGSPVRSSSRGQLLDLGPARSPAT